MSDDYAADLRELSNDELIRSLLAIASTDDGVPQLMIHELHRRMRETGIWSEQETP